MTQHFKPLCPLASQKYISVTYNCVKPNGSEAIEPKIDENVKKISKRYVRMNYKLKPDHKGYRTESYNSYAPKGKSYFF